MNHYVIFCISYDAKSALKLHFRHAELKIFYHIYATML